MNADLMLQAEGITKSYALDRTTLEVLRGIDLEVRRGAFISIVGASGSGKSTLLHILGGLDRPSAGRVLWSGRDIAGLKEEDLARTRGTNVGFVFQFHHLLGEFSALENVMIPMMIAGASGPDARRRASDLHNEVGLDSRSDHRPGELSGGEQQRVAVARALANAPAVLMADEPTGNLDSESGARLIDLLSQLNAARAQTVLVVTHDEHLASRATLRYRMADGRIERM
jgi:lipoprotein-releasing system ATP-binding protein